MTHLTDSQLNEYLDNILDEAEKQRCSRHLLSCAECRTHLNELQHLFASLDTLPEKNLQRDLFTDIIRRLPKNTTSAPQKQPRLWTPAFAAQVGIALGVFIWISTQAAQFVVPFVSTFQFSQLAVPTFQFAFPALQLSDLYILFSIPKIQLPAFRLPIFQLSNFNFAFIAISAFALWLAGNAALLRRRPEVRK